MSLLVLCITMLHIPYINNVKFDFFVYSLRRGQTGFLCMWISGCAILPLNCLGTIVKNQLTINVRVYVWTLSSIILIYISILMQTLSSLL